MGENGVLVFPDAAKGAASSIDPNLLLALQNNGGLGGNGGWFWIILLYMMWQRNGCQGNFNDFAAQYSGSEGRQYLAEIMNGRFDNLGNLANILNTSVEGLKSGIFALQTNISQVGANVGLTAAQTQNAIALGNAALAKQLCECCCQNQLAIANQTSALQAQAAANHSAAMAQSASNFAASQLQMAQNHADDRLDVCSQTNTLQNQSERNTNAILGAISSQNAMLEQRFCEIKEREMQSKIDTQGDIITQLRGQISNDKQTEAFTLAFNTLNEKINILSAKSPNTVPVVYPNLTAVNNTPYATGFNPWGYGFGGQSYWG